MGSLPSAHEHVLLFTVLILQDLQKVAGQDDSCLCMQKAVVYATGNSENMLYIDQIDYL